MYTLFSENHSSPQNKIDHAIFSAMPEELAELRIDFSSYPLTTYRHRNFEFSIYDMNGFRVLLTPTGIGTTFAASAIMLVNTLFKVGSMFFIGTAGGIHDDLNIRDIILVESSFEAELQNLFPALEGTPFESCLIHPLKNERIKLNYFADQGLLGSASSINIPTYKGTVVTSNTFPSHPEIFPALKKANVLAIDMETSAFYQIAWLLNVPALAIRAVSNKLDCTGQDKDIGSSDIKGSIKVASNCLIHLLEALQNTKILKNVEDIPNSDLFLNKTI